MNATPHPDCAASAHAFAVGDRVYLRGARFGLPGTVLRMERGRAVIYWRDMDHISRHRPVTLMRAEEKGDSDAA
jgi:hypothetical protein